MPHFCRVEKFLTAWQVKALETKHRYCKEKRQADRIKTILYLNLGDSFEEVAKRLLLDDSTLRNYHAEYMEGGIEKLLTDDYTGGQSRLSDNQMKQLDQHLDEHTYSSSKEIGAYIEKRYGITYTTEGIKDILYRMNYSYKKPKHLPGKADRDAQEKFIEEYERLKENKKARDKIYFMDGTHPLHNSQLGYGWIKRGEEKFIKANTGRDRININGAYNIEEHKVIVREDESINGQSTVALLEQMLKEQPLGMLYIILDNARYYHSKPVMEFLAKSKRIQFMYLPPYSPNLNLIERLWKFMKEKITRLKYYEKFSEFKRKIMGFFKNIKIYTKELESRMTENFQLFPT